MFYTADTRGSIETIGHYDSLQLHPWIKSTPCNDKGLAFTYGRHSETHNYRPACAWPGLAAPRRPSLVVQEIYHVGTLLIFRAQCQNAQTLGCPARTAIWPICAVLSDQIGWGAPRPSLTKNPSPSNERIGYTSSRLKLHGGFVSRAPRRRTQCISSECASPLSRDADCAVAEQIWD